MSLDQLPGDERRKAEAIGIAVEAMGLAQRLMRLGAMQAEDQPQMALAELLERAITRATLEVRVPLLADDAKKIAAATVTNLVRMIRDES